MHVAFDHHHSQISLGNRERYRSIPLPLHDWSDVYQEANDGKCSMVSTLQPVFGTDWNWPGCSTTSTYPPPYVEAAKLLGKEAELGLQTLRNFDDVQLLCKFPFEDANTLCRVLARKQGAWLNALWSNLHGSSRNSGASHTAQEIVNFLRQKDSSSPPVWDGRWTLPAITFSMGATTIAEKLDFAICSTFCRVSFYSWVRYALGYEDTCISCFLDGVSNSRNDLARYFRKGDLSKDKWKSVVEALSCRHPLARWLFDDSDSSDPCDALSFLFDPVRQQFAKPLDLKSLMKRLEILAIRFNNNIVLATHVDWDDPFSTGFSFLEAIESQRPEDLAKSITDADSKIFIHISPADFLDIDSKRLRQLAVEWSCLCDDTTACLRADRSLGPYLMVLAERLTVLRNYNSATAISLGIHKGGCWPVEPSPIWLLIHPENNFAACRARSKQGRCLPYIPSLIHELRQSEYAVEKLYGAFRFVEYFGSDQMTCSTEIADMAETADVGCGGWIGGHTTTDSSNNTMHLSSPLINRSCIISQFNKEAEQRFNSKELQCGHQYDISQALVDYDSSSLSEPPLRMEERCQLPSHVSCAPDIATSPSAHKCVPHHQCVWEISAKGGMDKQWIDDYIENLKQLEEINKWRLEECRSQTVPRPQTFPTLQQRRSPVQLHQSTTLHQIAPVSLRPASSEALNLRTLSSPKMPLKTPFTGERSHATAPKRQRGRPRKNPAAKPIKPKIRGWHRSRRGCLTCRRRKKRCDETKPSCTNCDKHNVICEYLDKRTWEGKNAASPELILSERYTPGNKENPPVSRTDIRSLLNPVIEEMQED